MLKAANIKFASSRTYSAWYTKMCFAFSVHRVILSKKFMFFMRIFIGDYDVWNPYLGSAQRLQPNVYRRQCSVTCSASVEVLYHDVRHAE
jgi:hypothetical protein